MLTDVREKHRVKTKRWAGISSLQSSTEEDFTKVPCGNKRHAVLPYKSYKTVPYEDDINIILQSFTSAKEIFIKAKLQMKLAYKLTKIIMTQKMKMTIKHRRSIPEKLAIIRTTSDGPKCYVLHQCKISETFEVQSGVC